MPIPRILVGGTSSGVGKTSLTLGIVRVLGRRGLRVRTFKVGPDFLDPSYLSAASAQTCYNLDGWMTGQAYVRDLFARAAAGADLAVIEGVMGLFDEADPAGLDGSSAQIAAWLDAPVVLVADAHGASRSLAAVVRGFADFEPSVRVAGVIANRCGSARHVQGLGASLAAAHCPPLVGAMPRDAMATLQHRHLGLVTADADVLDEPTLEQLADAADKHLDLDQIVELARGERVPYANKAHGRPSVGSPANSDISKEREDSEKSEGGRSNNVSRALKRSRQSQGAHGKPSVGFERLAVVRIGVARDRAFHFYYPDNLEALREAGAELVEFSPLSDAHLPAGLGGLYLGGGYPEVHAAALAANGSMLADVRALVADGGCVYAECGGLMYLGQSVRTLDGAVHELAGVLPVRTRMLQRLRALGYVEACFEVDCAWGLAGESLRGHEFHYSEIESDDLAAQGWQRVYRLMRRSGSGSSNSGIPARDSSSSLSLSSSSAAASEEPRPGMAALREESRPGMAALLGEPKETRPGMAALREESRPGMAALLGEPKESRPGMVAVLEGFHKGNVLASYVHLHWAGRAESARRFVEQCGRHT